MLIQSSVNKSGEGRVLLLDGSDNVLK